MYMTLNCYFLAVIEQEGVCERLCELRLQHISGARFSRVQARVLPGVRPETGEAFQAKGTAGSAGGERLPWLGKVKTGTCGFSETYHLLMGGLWVQKLTMTFCKCFPAIRTPFMRTCTASTTQQYKCFGKFLMSCLRIRRKLFCVSIALNIFQTTKTAADQHVLLVIAVSLYKHTLGQFFR